MLGGVLDGHKAGEFQCVPFKGLGIAPALIREPNLDLSDQTAGLAVDARNLVVNDYGLRPMGRVRTFSRFDHAGVLPTNRKPSNTTVSSPGQWRRGWSLQRRLSECRCIPESRTHGTTSWWTFCVSNLKRIIDATSDWASMSTLFKACTLPPDEPESSTKTFCGRKWIAAFENTHSGEIHPQGEIQLQWSRLLEKSGKM